MSAVGTTAAGWDAATWRAVGALVLVAAAPGLAVARVARRSAAELTLLQRSAAGIACGALSWLLISETLVRAGILTTGPVWTSVGVVGTVSIAVLVWDARAARTPGCRSGTCTVTEPSIAVAAPPDLRMKPWPLRGFATSVVPALLVAGSLIPQLRLIRAGSMISPTSWYYWLIASSIAVRGQVPDTLIEWGQPVTTFTFHFGFSSSSAFLSVASGDLRSLAPVVAIRVSTLLLFVFGLWALTRALGASAWCATAVAILAQFVDVYAVKLSSYRPESTGYGLAFLAVALLIWGLRTRSRTLLVAGVAATVAGSQIHEISMLLALCLMVGVALIVMLRALRTPGRRLSILAPVLAFGGSALVLTIAVNSVMIGQWSEGDAVAGLPTISNGHDPTWAFSQLVGDRLNVANPGYGAPDTWTLTRDSLQARILGLPAVSLMALSIVLGVALVCAAARSKPARRLIVLALVSLGCMLLISYVLSSAGDTYVPRRTGYQRLLQLWPVLPLIVLAAAVATLPRRPLRGLLTAVLVGASIVVAALAPAGSQFRNLDASQPSAAQLSALQHAPVPAGSIVLTNGFTQGFVTLQTGAHGLLDGQAPYTVRDLLHRANTILKLTHRYFAEPAEHPFPFCSYGVRYVLASRKSYALGTPNAWTGGPLTSDNRLTLVEANVSFVLYRVAADCSS